MSVATRLQDLQPTDIGVPGPTSLDMARAFRSIRADPLSFLVSVSERFGDLVSFPVPGPPALLVNDPADARHVLQTAARNWGKQTVQYAALARVTGPGLLASAEPSWIEHRRLAAPAFHRQRLDAVAEQVRAAARDSVGARLAPGGAGEQVVDVAALTHRVGLDAVGRALFSADLSGQAQQLLTATSDAADLVVRLGRSILPTAEWTPTRDEPPPALGAPPPRRERRGDHRPAACPAVDARLARRRPARPADRQRPHGRRDPRRAGHHGHRRPRDRRRSPGLDPDAAGRAPAGPGTRAGRAGGATPARCR